jgi:chemotaxis signal transduction protein
LAVEYNNRLEAVLIVMGVEQRQLLAAVDSVERVVEIKRDAFRRGGRRSRT